MNRQIKFRQPVYNLDGSLLEFFYWGVFDNDEQVEVIHPLSRKYIIDKKITEPSESVQFTGLLDKNGKEIYEGDILQQWYFDQYGKVIYEGSCFKVEQKDEPICHTLDAFDMKDIQVIGNIFENPELLNQ